MIWHLNVRGLKLLAMKNMVIGLPEIDGIDLCEGCVYGKLSRNLFPLIRLRGLQITLN